MHPGEGVPHDCPARVAEVQRAGGVGRDELDVEPTPRKGLGGAVGRSGRHDIGGDGPLGARLDPDVEEPGAGDLGRRDPVGGTEPLGQQGGEVARLHPGLLAELEGDVGRVVAVLLALRSLDDHGGGDAVGQRQRSLVHEGGEDVDDAGRELFRSHRARVSACRTIAHIDISIGATARDARRPAPGRPGSADPALVRQPAHQRHQFGRLEGLGEVPVGAYRLGPRQVGGGCPARHDHQRDLGRVGIGP